MLSTHKTKNPLSTSITLKVIDKFVEKSPLKQEIIPQSTQKL